MVQVVKTLEGKAALSFLLSEAAGQRSRENGVVASGQGKLPAGQVLAGTQAAMVAYTDGATALGILNYAVDATDEAVDVSYMARDCEVNQKQLTYPEESTSGNEAADMIASLKLHNIIVRD